MDGAICVPLERNSNYWFKTWEQGFCCWKSEEGGRTYPIVFPYRMVDERKPDCLHEDLDLLFSVAHGLGMTQPEPGHYSIGIDTAKVDRSMLMLLQELLLTIPENIRVLASRCGKYHYLALEAMRHVPEFTEFLEQEVNGAGMSYVLAVWALGKAVKQPRIFRLELAQRMMTLSRIRMLETLTDAPCSHALLRLLAKLPPDEIKLDVVWTAMDAMARPAMRKSLGGLKLMTAEALSELMQLPDWLVTPTLVHVLAGSLHEGQTLTSILPPSLLTAPEEAHERLRQSLSGAKTLAALEKRIYQWADRLYYEVSFPAPPMRGNDKLKPLRTGLMLRQEGWKMQNCVAGYAEDVLAGKSYFYAWRGNIRATVQLGHTHADRWRLTEALGSENEELPADEWISVVAALAQAFGDTGLFLCRCSIAGTGHYDFEKAKPVLTDGMDLRLRREPDNIHDANAIEVLTPDGIKMGYMPRAHNEDAARWMDAGLAVSVRFLSTRGCQIEISVFEHGKG